MNIGITGAILGYFAFLLLAISAGVIFLGIRYNWRGSAFGLAANTILTSVTEVGLLIFLVVPGHVSFSEALAGLFFWSAGVLLGGMACRKEHQYA